jgi:hypothetical protein
LFANQSDQGKSWDDTFWGEKGNGKRNKFCACPTVVAVAQNPIDIEAIGPAQPWRTGFPWFTI